jgi:hypothetical protein
LESCHFGAQLAGWVGLPAKQFGISLAAANASGTFMRTTARGCPRTAVPVSSPRTVAAALIS